MAQIWKSLQRISTLLTPQCLHVYTSKFYHRIYVLLWSVKSYSFKQMKSLHPSIHITWNIQKWKWKIHIRTLLELTLSWIWRRSATQIPIAFLHKSLPLRGLSFKIEVVSNFYTEQWSTCFIIIGYQLAITSWIVHKLNASSGVTSCHVLWSDARKLLYTPRFVSVPRHQVS
jgi:hypothetical protein